MDPTSLATHSLLLSSSFLRLVGKDLAQWLGADAAKAAGLGHSKAQQHKPDGKPTSVAEQLAHSLYHAPCALLSHGVEADPIFNYGNARALTLFDVSWAQLTRMPSRLSATPTASAARSQLMAEVQRRGFYENYTGERISASGRKFYIAEATIWNVVDELGVYRGQAAAIRRTIPVESPA